MFRMPEQEARSSTSRALGCRASPRRNVSSSPGRLMTMSHEMWITSNPVLPACCGVDVMLPLANAEMMFPSVTFDRNHEIGIGKVDSGNEGAALVEDLVLPLRLGKAMCVEKVQQLPLERASTHGELKLALVQDLRHQARPDRPCPPKRSITSRIGRSAMTRRRRASSITLSSRSRSKIPARSITVRIAFVIRIPVVPAKVSGSEFHDSSNLNVCVRRS
jgi:hypothetical protein